MLKILKLEEGGLMINPVTGATTMLKFATLFEIERQRTLRQGVWDTDDDMFREGETIDGFINMRIEGGIPRMILGNDMKEDEVTLPKDYEN